MQFLILKLNVGQRLMVIICIAIVTAAMLAWLGIDGISKSNNSIKAVYENRMESTVNLSKIKHLMLENRTFLRIALSEVEINSSGARLAFVMNKAIAEKSAEAIEQNIVNITGLWESYMQTYLTPQEKILAAKFLNTHASFVADSLKPAIQALRSGNYKASKPLNDSAHDLYKVAGAELDALINLQFNIAQEAYLAGVKRFENTRMLAIGTLAIAVVILMWLGLLMMRSITRPLANSIRVFEQMAAGNFESKIEIKANDELSPVLQRLNDLQNQLSADFSARESLAVKVKEQSVLYEGQVAAINQSACVIEFSMDGKVMTANKLFLDALGYRLDEVVGQHHSHFVTSPYRDSTEYRQFWEKLNRGESVAGEFLCAGKDGKEVWLEARYNVILCAAGTPIKVIKYANDISQLKIQNASFESQIEAINKSKGVIEIGLDGKIIKANEAYLNMLGYTELELVGHSVELVLDPAFLKSTDYAQLWDKLIKGGHHAGQDKRIAKDGKEVWIKAYYHSIYDAHGKPYKIVNYATDITEIMLRLADFEGQTAGINRVQGVIEFDMTGKIIAVNENFVKATGYAEQEMVGHHHSMFVEDAYSQSHEYKVFWEQLNRGEASVAQYKCIGKGNKEIWLHAIYNPIMDMNGKPFKVVKYATDITAQRVAAENLGSVVQETHHIIEAAKFGDLTSRVSLTGKTGDIASLCDGVNALMDKVTEVIVQVRAAGEAINTAADEISAGNTDLSSRTEQQASSLEETASSMEELASTVKQNAENAKQANQLASAASGIAIKGGEVVGQVVNTMGAINQSARKIENIISVIDGIAFQTNILALNAAVEAARAGEQGRGFAVVAGEVRNLAQRSASAAKEIKELIADSVSKTTEGTVLVENAGKTMQEIVFSVQRVTDMMGEISAASIEQSVGIDQVNHAIASMDEVTQQNAALVEEATAAAILLVDQAVSLVEVVSDFKLTENATTSRSNPRKMMVIRSDFPKPSIHQASHNRPIQQSTQMMTKTGTDDGDWEEF